MACKVSAALRLGFGFSSGFFRFFGLPELLDQSGPFLRRCLGDSRHSFLGGFDAAGQDFLFDAGNSFFCSIYALAIALHGLHNWLRHSRSNAFTGFFFRDQVHFGNLFCALFFDPIKRVFSALYGAHEILELLDVRFRRPADFCRSMRWLRTGRKTPSHRW